MREPLRDRSRLEHMLYAIDTILDRAERNQLGRVAEVIN